MQPSRPNSPFSDDDEHSYSLNDAPIDISNDFASLSRSTRQASKDLAARLYSIDEDARYVKEVKEANKTLPVVANLRCGAWYVPPDIAEPATPAYFKSTDGHEGQWEFNLRRANLHLLPLIETRGGVILVDSTRRGKRYPDALSKTIPLWCATINRALSLRARRAGTDDSRSTSSEGTDNEEDTWAPRIWVSSRSVSDQERAKMEERLDGWAEKLLASSLHLPSLTLPIRPIFLHRPSTSSPSPPPSLPWSTELGFFPVVCLSASQYIEEGADRRRPTHGGWEYVQGAGDDHELWTVGGWGSEQFWGWKDELFGGRSKGGEEGEEDGEEPEGLERRVERLVKEWKEGKSKTKTEEGGKDVDAFIYPIPTVVRPTSLLHLSILPQPPNSDVPTVTLHRHSSPLPSPSNPLHLPLAYNPAKGGITPCIAPTLTFLSPHLDQDEPKPFVIAGDDNAKDESVGIALVVLQRFFDEEGRELKEGEAGVKATKATISKRLSWIQNALPGAHPSRATLKRVNTFCMSGMYNGKS